jgi:hypothetical protein
MTIGESFTHDDVCVRRPRPTLTDVVAALAEVRPRYLAAGTTAVIEDAEIWVHIDPAAEARFHGPDDRMRYRSSADNRIGEPLLAKGFRLTHCARGTKVY